MTKKASPAPPVAWASMNELWEEAIDNKRVALKKLPFLGNTSLSPFFEGWSHLMSAYPKTGKTELMVRVVRDWPLKTAWLTEEPRQVWLARQKTLTQEYGHMDVFFALGAKRDSVLAIVGQDYQAIVIDTLRLMSIRDENSNSEIYRSLSPLLSYCQEVGKTLVLLHHARKSAGEFGERVAGGHAFSGMVDVVMELQRYKNVYNRRRMQTLSRVVSLPDVLYDWNGETLEMEFIGTEDDVSVYGARQQLLPLLTLDWQTTRELGGQTTRPRLHEKSVYRALTSMAESQQIERDPSITTGSRAGKTYRWRLVG